MSDTQIKLLETQIKQFLSEHRKSDGGWAQITKNDITDLYKVIETLIKLKCDSDSDGDYPIEAQLVNRRIERGIWPFAFPYDSDPNDPLASHGKIRQLCALVADLSKELSTSMVMLDCHRQYENREKTKLSQEKPND